MWLVVTQIVFLTQSMVGGGRVAFIAHFASTKHLNVLFFFQEPSAPTPVFKLLGSQSMSPIDYTNSVIFMDGRDIVGTDNMGLTDVFWRCIMYSALLILKGYKTH